MQKTDYESSPLWKSQITKMKDSFTKRASNGFQRNYMFHNSLAEIIIYLLQYARHLCGFVGLHAVHLHSNSSMTVPMLFQICLKAGMRAGHLTSGIWFQHRNISGICLLCFSSDFYPTSAQSINIRSWIPSNYFETIYITHIHIFIPCLSVIWRQL